MKVIDFYDAAARKLGFRDYAELAAAEEAAFDAEWAELERKCTHPDKVPGLDVCQPCAESFRR